MSTQILYQFSLITYLIAHITNLNCAQFFTTLDANHSTMSNLRNEQKIMRDSAVLQFLSTLKGNPTYLSQTELNRLRRHMPQPVEKWINLINNERFLLQFKHGKVPPVVFDDFRKSIVFLDFVSCKYTFQLTNKVCFVLQSPTLLPKQAIHRALLHVQFLPWVDTRKLILQISITLKVNGAIKHYATPLINRTRLIQSTINNEYYNAIWDLTDILHKIQMNGNNYHFPIRMMLGQDSNLFDSPNRDYSINMDQQMVTQFVNLNRDNLLDINNNENNDNIIFPNSQIILQMKTGNTLHLESNFAPQRISERSFINENKYANQQACPSFLDRNHRETKCCLLRYTLNKLQIDQNEKIHFIIFPHHLPLNMCHGRCIGLYIPTDNAHSILLNRYYSGLGPEEREAIYNSMPCCAANETIPFTILYKNQNGQLITETLPKAVKTNCACN